MDGLQKVKNPVTSSRHAAAVNTAKRRKFDAASSHLFSLHSRGLETGQRDSSYLSFNSCTPLRNTELMSEAFRSSSVRISLVAEKLAALSSSKMGSSQQTTRVSSQPIVASWAPQAAAVAVALGVARVGNKDPRGTWLASPAQLFAHASGTLCATASTSVIVANSAPIRLTSFSILETMAVLAREELETRCLSSRISQDSVALQTICHRVLSEACEGDGVWAAQVLLGYLS